MTDKLDSPQDRRVIDAAAMFVVALASLVLLLYVAYGEAKRTYEQFQLDKLSAQGEVVKTAIEGFVRAGLPISQYVGFNALAEPVVKADPLIDAIAAYDTNGVRIFRAGDDTSIIESDDGGFFNEKASDVRRSGEMLQVVLAVHNRFERVGYVIMSVNRAKLAKNVENAFKPLVVWSFIAAIAFGVFVYVFSYKLPLAARRSWVAGGFAVTFIGVAVYVVLTLVNVYSDGAQSRAKSIANDLGQRLDDIVILNIRLADVTGLDAIFASYKRLNPELRSAGLTLNDKIIVHTDGKQVGQEWKTVDTDYEYAFAISRRGAPQQFSVRVALPRDIVTKQVFRNVKNFIALFIASALFAALFMGLAQSLQRIAGNAGRAWSEVQEQATIELVKPVFFLAVFVEHLSYAFLPTLVQSYAAASNVPAGFGSLPFVGYYICFALSLMPTSRLEARLGAKSIILLGLVLASAGLVSLMLTSDFWLVSLARMTSGWGQGTLFIGVQAYVLANSAPARRTQAGGAIVFGFQAGMIAGMAIGSLLVSYVGPTGIFEFAAAICLLTAIYGWFALPSRVSGGEAAGSLNSAWRDLYLILKDGQFFRTILLVGVPAKAVLTGIMLFAMPLLLSKQGFVKEDIGQITMVYAAAVMVSSYFASKLADKSQNTESILFKGTCLTACGLLIASLAGAPAVVNWAVEPALGTGLILTGVLLVGTAHGFINAPVVTHVTMTHIAAERGSTSVAAAYRLLERLGHIAGPLIMGQVFSQFGVSWISLAVCGIIIFIMGTLFLSPARPIHGGSQPQSARGAA